MGFLYLSLHPSKSSNLSTLFSVKTSTKLISRTPVFIMPLNQVPQQAVNMPVKKTSPTLNRLQSHMVLIWEPAYQAQSLTQREFRRTRPQAGRVRKPAFWGFPDGWSTLTHRAQGSAHAWALSLSTGHCRGDLKSRSLFQYREH